MKEKICIKFVDTVDIEFAEHLLNSAVVAVESITGETRLNAEAAVDFDQGSRTIALVTGGPAGEALRRSVLALLREHFYADEYSIRSCSAAASEGVSPSAASNEPMHLVKITLFAVAIA